MNLDHAGYKDAVNNAMSQGLGIGQSQKMAQLQVAPPQPRAVEIVARLEVANKRLAELCSQAEAVVDRIIGMDDPSLSAGSAEAPSSSGLLGEIESLDRQLHARLSRLQAALGRLSNAF